MAWGMGAGWVADRVGEGRERRSPPGRRKERRVEVMTGEAMGEQKEGMVDRIRVGERGMGMGRAGGRRAE